MSQITNEHMDLIQEKYGDLFWYIAQRIGLDPILHDNEDCVQDLKLVALKVIFKFKRDKYPELSIEEILNLPYFDKYLKTSLWNYKNNVGAKISQKYEKLKSHELEIKDKDGEEGNAEIANNLLYEYGKYSTSSNFDIEEFTARMGELAKDVVKGMYGDDEACLTSSVDAALKKRNLHISKDHMSYAVSEEVKRAVGRK